MLCVCVSIGAWAEGNEDGYWLSFDTWFQNVSAKTELAAKIHLTKGGVLSNAIAELQAGSKKGTYYPGGVATEFDFSQCKILYINGESITNADLTALANLNIETIVLQDATWTATTKSFVNTNVKNLILPDNWTKEEVNAIGEAIGAASGNKLGSCFSRGDYTHTGDVTTYSYTDGEGTHTYTGDVTESEGNLTGIIDVHHTLALHENGTNPYYYYTFDGVKTYLSGDEEGLNTEKTQYTFYPSKEVKLNGPETKMYKQDGVTEIHSHDGDVGIHTDDNKWYYGGTNKNWNSNPPTVEGGTEAIVKELYTYQDPYTYQGGTIEATDPRIHDGADGKYITITRSTQETVSVYKEYQYYYLFPEDAEDIEANRTPVTYNNETSTIDYVEHVTVNLDSETHSETTNLGSSIIAYVNRGNTLRDATLHAFLDNKANTAIGNWNLNSQQMSNVVAASISGNAVALDIAGGNVVAQSDGHLLYDKDADEMGKEYGDAVGGGKRTLQGTSQPGALYGASLQKLDLEDAIIEDEHCADITISALSIINDKKSQVIIPTYTGLKTIPADFMNMSTSIRSICIPSNIEIIRTRAFYTIDYVWTTAGENDPEGVNTKLDNGTQYTIDGEVVYGSTAEDFDYNTVSKSGTYTFSSNLKLIETAAFANTQPHVKDVYVLNTVAPECHVDAFNTVMYLGNGGYAPVIEDGIITRDSYQNNGYWITMLHYPRQTTTPNVQRYTDPTRAYSIATGQRDGKGAMLYFPNQSEFIRAYMQGTYGYTWNAWDPTRTDGAVTNTGLTNTTSAWNIESQNNANTLYTTYKTKIGASNIEPDHKYFTFYDVTAGGAASNVGEDIVPYWQINRSNSSYSAVTSGGNLYPQDRDFRGWHQFVITEYAANTTLEEIPLRSYITDNEWWTICPTFDITRGEAAILYGSMHNVHTSGPSTYPYVSKLRYVIRNYYNKKIILNFTQSLTAKKEERSEATAKHGINQTVNGILSILDETPGEDDIVMSAGVPYLIKPTFPAGSSRQFRIFKNTQERDKFVNQYTTEEWETVKKQFIIVADESLYNKMKAALAKDGSEQMADIHQGKYTVPVFVSEAEGNGIEREALETLSDGTNKTYKINGITHFKSIDWKYTFVGTFYKSFLPLHSYFLGWDSSLNNGNGGARFYYYDQLDDFTDNNMTWANETGIICPTKSEFTYEVTPAAGKEPAQWNLKGKIDDDSYVAMGASSKSYEMAFNAPDIWAEDGEATAIKVFDTTANNRIEVYSVDGQYMGNSLNGLARGIYVVNGKKYVVK